MRNGNTTVPAVLLVAEVDAVDHADAEVVARFRHFPVEVHLIHVLDLKRFCGIRMSELSNTIENSSRDGLKPSKLSSNKILYQDRNTNGGFSELRTSENCRPALEMTVLKDSDSISRLEGF